MSSTGDMTFGGSGTNFLANSPETVRQAMITRLGLWTGQWFLDGDAGTPWSTSVLGKNYKAVYDAAITDRIQGTPGFLAILDYSSSLNTGTRNLTFSATVNTLYGTTNVNSAMLAVQLPKFGTSDLGTMITTELAVGANIS